MNTTTEVQKLDMSLYQNAIAVFAMGDKKIVVRSDEYAEDPLDWGHFEFFSTHKKYYTKNKNKTIADKEGNLWGIGNFDSLEEIEAFLSKNDYLYRFVYIYEHSGFCLWTSEKRQNPNGMDMFFDSGCFGFLYVSKEKVRRNYGVKRITKKIQEQVYEHIDSFVSNEWEMYFNGEIYEYEVINNQGECEDSLCSLFGEESVRDFLNSKYQIEIPII